MRRQSTAPQLLRLLSYLFFSLLLAAAAPFIRGAGDIGLYGDIAKRVHLLRAGDIAELTSEYPPTASGLFWFIDLLNPFTTFHQAWGVAVPLMLCVACAYIFRIAKEHDGMLFAGSIALSSFLLGLDISFGRYDIFIALLLLLTWICHKQQRYAMSGIFLAIAIMLKGTPLLLVPFLFLATPSLHQRRLAMGMAAGVLGCLAFSLITLGIGGFIFNTTYMLSYHAERGIQQESTWSAINAFWQYLHGTTPDVVLRYGAWHNADLGAGTGLLSAITILGGLATYGAFLWWRRRNRKPISLSLALLLPLLWMLGWAPVLSPQYFMWVLPLLFFWIGERVLQGISSRESVVMMILTIFLGLFTYLLFIYTQTSEKTTFASIMVHNVRSVLIFAVGGLALLLELRKKKPVSKKKVDPTRFTSLLLPLAVFLSLAAARVVYVPTFANVTYMYDGETRAHEASLPLVLPSAKQHLLVSFTMHASPLRPSVYRVKPDDCIYEMKINDLTLPPSPSHFCDYGEGKEMNLARYIKTGANAVLIRMRDDGGLARLRITPGNTDPVGFVFKILFALILGWLCIVVTQLTANQSKREIAYALCLGIFLRILYYVSTPYSLRGHDTDAHIDYIRYIATHMTIPAAQDGWEYHQNPLYYVITGIFMRVASWMHIPDPAILSYVQLLSLFFSIVTLFIAAWIAVQLFPGAQNRWKAALVVGITGVIPSLIFNAARITNDVLYMPLALLTIGLLVRFARTGAWRDWYIMSIIFAFAFLAKISVLALGPAIALTYLLHRGTRWREHVAHGIASFLLVVACIGWLLVLRLGIEEQTSRFRALGNEGMHSGLQIENTWDDFLTFNPVKVLARPYNNPWSDEARREYYWEYLFRATFTGEFSFPSVLTFANILILLLGIWCLPLIVYGLWDAWRKRFFLVLPLACALFFLLLSSMWYRFSTAYSVNQDFRFIVIAVFPLAYFVVRGASALPPLFRRPALVLLWSFIGANALFLFLLYFFSP